jgi:hypothetical protein
MNKNDNVSNNKEWKLHKSEMDINNIKYDILFDNFDKSGLNKLKKKVEELCENITVHVILFFCSLCFTLFISLNKN